MQIQLKGHQKCNLFVGGDRRDKSIKNYIESSTSDMFLIKKSGDFLEIWGAEELVEEVPVISVIDDPVIRKPSKKKKE